MTTTNASAYFNLDSEVRLATTNSDRERFDELATLYGLIVSLDYLERAYVRDSIDSAQCVSLLFLSPSCLLMTRLTLCAKQVHASVLETVEPVQIDHEARRRLGPFTRSVHARVQGQSFIPRIVSFVTASSSDMRLYRNPDGLYGRGASLDRRRSRHGRARFSPRRLARSGRRRRRNWKWRALEQRGTFEMGRRDDTGTSS